MRLVVPGPPGARLIEGRTEGVEVPVEVGLPPSVLLVDVAEGEGLGRCPVPLSSTSPDPHGLGLDLPQGLPEDGLHNPV